MTLKEVLGELMPNAKVCVSYNGMVFSQGWPSEMYHRFHDHLDCEVYGVQKTSHGITLVYMGDTH